jgi:hypothetical protein
MSCRPLSWFFASVDRYEKSLDSASSSRFCGFELAVMEYATRLTRKVADRRGIGSSGLFDWLRNDMKC